jgi:hypothetical protein
MNKQRNLVGHLVDDAQRSRWKMIRKPNEDGRRIQNNFAIVRDNIGYVWPAVVWFYLLFLATPITANPNPP